MFEPWNGERDRIMFFDLRDGAASHSYSPTGADVRADNWEVCTIKETAIA